SPGGGASLGVGSMLGSNGTAAPADGVEMMAGCGVGCASSLVLAEGLGSPDFSSGILAAGNNSDACCGISGGAENAIGRWATSATSIGSGIPTRLEGRIRLDCSIPAITVIASACTASDAAIDQDSRRFDTRSIVSC